MQRLFVSKTLSQALWLALATLPGYALFACSDNAGKATSDATGGGLSSSGGDAQAGHSAKGGTTGSGGAGSVTITAAGALGSEAGAGGEATCGATRLQANPPQVNILLVIDKSSSMNSESGFSKSKWLALGDALGGALSNSKDRVAFGLSFFPFSDDLSATPKTCETPSQAGPLVPVSVGADSVPKILTALKTYAPAGGTPTSAALKAAHSYFTTGAGRGLAGTSYVLLATDGGPNCDSTLSCDASTCTLNMEGFDCGGNCCAPSVDPNGAASCLDADGSVAGVTALAAAGIKTFVVGIPGSEVYHATLDRLAQAGQAPQQSGPPYYYAVQADGDASGLTDVLTRITTGVIKSCQLQLASTPPDFDKLNVEIDSTPIPQLGPDGWLVDRTTSPPTIVLEGATCKRMETMGAQTVDVTFGCPTLLVPR